MIFFFLIYDEILGLLEWFATTEYSNSLTPLLFRIGKYLNQCKSKYRGRVFELNFEEASWRSGH
jgi:hypothetical protein